MGYSKMGEISAIGFRSSLMPFLAFGWVEASDQLRRQFYLVVKGLITEEHHERV